jgi:hypothetical protein
MTAIREYGTSDAVSENPNEGLASFSIDDFIGIVLWGGFDSPQIADSSK